MDDGDLGGYGQPIHVLMAGGGTGGHVFPALAVASELQARGHEVSWAGRIGGMEQTLVESAGLDFHALDAKPWVGQGVTAKIRAAATLITSSWRGRRVVGRTGADVVLGTGGYVSTPAVLGARLAGRPAFVLEPNARAGAANRLAGRWATAAFVAHEATTREFSCDAQLTGIPVRAAFHAVGPLPSGPPHLLILGGSQGAQQINELMPGVVARLAAVRGLEGLTVTHQTGGAHLASVEVGYQALGLAGGHGVAVSPVAFIDDVATAMAKAHLVVSRAGALATAELAAAGRPAVLIPLLAAGAGHQRLNAERMQASKAARALTGNELDAETLSKEIRELLTDRSRLEAMSRAARSLGKPEAASRIADALERAGGRR
ncbi:MAG: undecaprenyldiphospho-muramoylpentapeptide beta-N-acetylglucosaminyltransferase [Thermoanaerobaculia bacterium]